MWKEGSEQQPMTPDPVAWLARRACKRQREHDDEDEWARRRRGRSFWVAGCILVTPVVLQFLDLIFPATCRTLLEFFTCPSTNVCISKQVPESHCTPRIRLQAVI